MLNTFRARSTSEQDAKFVQDRIVCVERSMSEMCHVLGQYSRKAARLRDKGDEVSKFALGFAESEEINKSLSEGLAGFGECVSALSSYGDMRVQSLDDKVVKELGRYEEICKRAKEDVRQIYNAREKEVARKRQLDRIKERNPRSRQQIIQAETELVKATAEVAKTAQNLEEKTTAFEKQKLHDIKGILLDLVTTELGYHAKALEVLTNAYNAIDSIDEEADLEDFQKVRSTMEAEFKRSLRIGDPTRTARNAGLFRPSNSLGSLGAMFASKKAAGIPQGSRGISKSEETLDTAKQSISDTENSDSQNSDNLTDTEDKSSPMMVRKYQK